MQKCKVLFICPEGVKRINSKDYWAKREEETLKLYIRDEAAYERELHRIYSDMLDSVQEQINGFYGRYAAAEGITIAEAKRRVTKADIAAYERKAAKYVKTKDFSPKANEEMRLYNTMMKVNRMEMLKANIGLELIAGHDELEKFMGKILKGRTMEELERQAGILGKTIRNNAAKAHAIVNGSFQVAKVGNKSTFSDRIWQYQDLMREDLGRLLQSGLIQGKNPRALVKDLRHYWYGNDPKTGGGALYCMQRLMRTELARVQTEAQKQSFERNGFDKYEFIANSGCCSACQGLNGKHFRVDKMMPGENAPPLHPNCRCSTAAWEDSKEYEAWLDYLANGGTTEEWNELKQTNLAKAINSMFLMNDSGEVRYSREEILEEMQKSPIGVETIRAIRDGNAKISISDAPRKDGARGEQSGNNIKIFSNNIQSVKVAGQTVIHEMAHYRFKIGGCQYAEAVCFAMEKMHNTGKTYLTESEWEYVKKLAIDNYPEYNWQEGGYGNYEQFDFVKPDN